MISHTIAALYVERDGAYYGLDDVDPWDRERDARLYDGPHPVVAHPPCERWGRYWYGGPMLHALGRRKTKGDDGGCFAMALRAVQRFGGVLEHPAASHAWRAFDIVAPPHEGGWVPAGIFHPGAFTCHVEQGHYGHRAPPGLPQEQHDARKRVLADIGWFTPELMSKRERSATPIPFRDVLLTIARTACADDPAEGAAMIEISRDDENGLNGATVAEKVDDE